MTTPLTPPPLLPRDRPLLHSVGIAAWCVVGIVAAVGVAFYGIAAISSLALPLLFAAVFAVLASPLQRRLTRWLPSAAAAGLIVTGIAAIVAGVIALMVVGIVDQSDRLVDEIESALQHFDISDDDIANYIDRGREWLSEAGSGVGSGAVGSVARGLSAVGQAVVGLFLGTIIFYYLLKDGVRMRRSFIERAPADQRRELDEFVGETFHILRQYWLGRTIVSAVVAVVVVIGSLVLGLPLVATIGVVTFVGGFIPYVGAFVGGALAVIVALGGSGPTAAVVMLGVVLVANVVIENLVEPLVTGRTLDVHPLVVLLATTLGATIAGIPGMIMAVPVVVISRRAIPIVRSFTGRADLDGIPNEIEDRAVGITDEPPAPGSTDASASDRD